MEIFDNVNKVVKDDLEVTIQKGSKLSVAAACFSIYAYKELKKQLENIDELRFIFTSPTFIKERAQKTKREFYIPRQDREKSLYGTEYEVKLRNELTQRAIAKECAEWVKRKVKFKSNTTNQNMVSQINVQTPNDDVCYSPFNEFTTTELGCEKGGNMGVFINKFDKTFSEQYLNLFNTIWNDDTGKLQDVTDYIIDSIENVYKENSGEFIYFITLFNIFNEFLEDISDDNMPNEQLGYKESAIWGKLYDFQKEAATAIISKLEKYNGCILADSVGLGKTFTALAVIKYYECRNKDVLVLCPKKLHDNWQTYRSNYLNNPLASDRLRYTVLYHTDLSRDKGESNGWDLEKINWSNFDLVVIDESHNFRNGGDIKNDKENRYLRLMNKVIRQGIKTKVLMLSATPVNNEFKDLKNQLALAYEGDSRNINDKLNTKKSIDSIFSSADSAYKKWLQLPAEQRTTENLLNNLEFDFFDMLDSVTIARSRKHIERYYNVDSIGKFPTRLPAKSVRPKLTENTDLLDYNQIYERIAQLNLKIYMPSEYIHDSAWDKYYDEDREEKLGNITSKQSQMGREKGIRRLMTINLLKRLESSVHSFRLTLDRVKSLITTTLDAIGEYEKNGKIKTIDVEDFTNTFDDFDEDDQNQDLYTTGKKFKINFKDMDYLSWSKDISADLEILKDLLLELEKITPREDAKLSELMQLIKDKINNPINNDNKKIIVFSAFADTADYLYDNVSKYVKDNFALNTALVTGQKNKTTFGERVKTDFNTILTYFSPKSKDKEAIYPNDTHNIDILIATDCISEGQNLQDCDYLVNYDIHWNPVRIIQRFGRIDRIGSKNEVIQLVNFWPDISLDDYINLKARVEARMKLTVMASTGTMSDDQLDENEKQDLEYRKKQLEKLQTEVVDLEEMHTGINIMDLGLNEFRLDLLNYIHENPDVENTPFGMHAVVRATETMPPGVIYILKNRARTVNIDNQNRLHPFYMVYIADDGNIICNHLEPKKMLDTMRFLCKKNSKPDSDICKCFNEETSEGKNMTKYSNLLGDAISSIINVKSEQDDFSILSMEECSFGKNEIKGLDDFELICFLVVKGDN